MAAGSWLPHHSFNPRPSRKRGATAPDFFIVRWTAVSILAPLARGALRDIRDQASEPSMFQSSPLSQEGRYGIVPRPRVWTY